MTWQILVGEWSDFAIRWLHVIAAVAWIGSSFYFIHLDLSLQKRAGLPEGVAGEAWQVHGGGFYNMQKYVVAPSHMPEDLTWFKWEAYMTFLSGFALLCVHYWANPELYLIDKTVLDLVPWQAVTLGVLTLALGWVVYDQLCKSPLGKNDVALFGVLYVYLVFIAWGMTHVFSGRGAFIEFGALIGTMMVANVAMIIIPKQRIVVKSLLAGEEPDPALGKAGKQRSLHNNYLTLPVVFLMISNHYPLSFGTQYNWLIIALVMIMGVAIRHFFNSQHAHKGNPWWTWLVAAACFVLIAWLSGFGPSAAKAAESKPVTAQAQKIKFADVQEIVVSRCSMCHAQEPVWSGVGVAPKGVMLETPDEIHLHAKQIYLQAVMSHAMPPGGNITEIAPEDRRILGLWFEQGASMN